MSASATDYLAEAKAAGEECRRAGHRYLDLNISVTVLCTPDHVGIGKKHSADCPTPGKRPWNTSQGG